MSTNLLFYYFGDDEAYYKALQGEFRTNSKLPIEFKKFYSNDEAKIQTFFISIFNLKPAVVFIDFSKQTADYMHLARILSRTPLEHKVLLVGLLDYLSPQEVLLESIATGVALTYIKSAEIFDVAFDVAKILSPNDNAAHGFANASLKNEEWIVGVPTKVGYIQGEGLHLETDYKMSKGDRVKLAHAWKKHKIIPSLEMFVKEVAESNMFYQFKRNADLDFVFMDEFLPPEGMEEDRIRERTQEREDMILRHKKHLKKWIEENMSRSQEKKAKVLIIDKLFNFYQQQLRTDRHPYTIRCVPFLVDVSQELIRLHPQVIAFNIENDDAVNPRNNNEGLVTLIQTIKNNYGEDYRPFIIIFNSKIPSKEMQDNHAYTNLMATTNELSVEVLVRMAEIFEKKLKKEEIPAGKEDLSKVFIKKTNADSFAEILVPITVIKISETDMIIQSEAALEIGMNLHITKPVDMYIHLLPTKATGKIPEYMGLIHCLGEDQKKELRKFVNSVFFREHDAKLSAETDEFKKLNEAKLQQKLDLEQKQAEAQSAPDGDSELKKTANEG